MDPLKVQQPNPDDSSSSDKEAFQQQGWMTTQDIDNILNPYDQDTEFHVMFENSRLVWRAQVHTGVLKPAQLHADLWNYYMHRAATSRKRTTPDDACEKRH